MMRKSLWEIYIEFPDCRSSYYDTNLSIDKLFGKEASEAKEECMNFIVNEFSKGSKKEVLNIFLDDRRKKICWTVLDRRIWWAYICWVCHYLKLFLSI